MFTARKTKSLTKKPKAKKKKRKQIKILLPAAVLQVAVLPAEAHQVHRLLTVIPKAKIKISLFMPMRQYLITNTGAVKIYLMQETIHHQTILTEFLLTRAET